MRNLLSPGRLAFAPNLPGALERRVGAERDGAGDRPAREHAASGGPGTRPGGAGSRAGAGARDRGDPRGPGGSGGDAGKHPARGGAQGPERPDDLSRLHRALLRLRAFRGGPEAGRGGRQRPLEQGGAAAGFGRRAAAARLRPGRGPAPRRVHRRGHRSAPGDFPRQRGAGPAERPSGSALRPGCCRRSLWTRATVSPARGSRATPPA